MCMPLKIQSSYEVLSSFLVISLIYSGFTYGSVIFSDLSFLRKIRVYLIVCLISIHSSSSIRSPMEFKQYMDFQLKYLRLLRDPKISWCLKMNHIENQFNVLEFK